MTVIQISALRRINNPKVLQFWLFSVNSVRFDCLCVVLLVYLCCVTCVFRLSVSVTWRTNTNGKKGYGWSAGNSFSCLAKMASATNLQDRPVPSTITRDRSLRIQSTSGKYKRRGNSDTVKVPLHERIRQFPDENFIVREGKLFWIQVAFFKEIRHYFSIFWLYARISSCIKCQFY